MVKVKQLLQGPCYHCGIGVTPLWRHGPVDKPVLCNACGSRWRTKGSLENYTPKYSNAVVRKQRSKSIGLPSRKTRNVLWRKRSVKKAKAVSLCDFTVGKSLALKSSKSNPELMTSLTCHSIQYEAMNQGKGADIQEGSLISSGKRSFSHIETLKRDLYAMFISQRFPSTIESSELIYNNPYGVQMYGGEIGLGVLLLNPPMGVKEIESRASPLSVEQDVSFLHDKSKQHLSIRDNKEEAQRITTSQRPENSKVLDSHPVTTNHSTSKEILPGRGRRKRNKQPCQL